ncbi:MAG TPA: M20/M25/M40 family metallo-hydrolase, partial [Candidatus Acidoferrales bacterium]|nr:M20/M25/M40 family metallo-hydrolase [Candidatus Acidoferrales bacterium]
MAKHPTSIQAQKNPNGAAGELARDPRVARALDYLAKNSAAITEEQAKITEIPAPPFQEAQRAAYLKILFASAGANPRTDDAGNVIAEFGVAQNGEVVVLIAHLDTVFPAGTNTSVRRDKNVLYAPGISDNGTGLASIVALARAFADAKIKTQRGVVFAADVGEEGEGNLRGARKLVETYGSRLKAMIAVDGASTDYVVAQALASRRLQVTITGPGGHSWSDFGTPNPINAIARGINRFLQVQVPGSPKTTYNVGEIEGGSSVNAIPASASIKVDFRSEQERELGRLETALRDAMKEGIASEMSMARERGQPGGKDSELQMEVKSLGVRPG